MERNVLSFVRNWWLFECAAPGDGVQKIRLFKGQMQVLDISFVVVRNVAGCRG